MNSKEAAKILGVSVMTVSRKCQDGKLKATKKEIPGAKGFEWEIDDASVISLANSRLNPSTEQSVSPAPVSQPIIDDPENREIIVNTTKAISKKEAERIIKQEEAIRRQRENLIEDGKIIEADEILETVGSYFGSLLQAFDSWIDVISIEKAWTQDETKKFQSRFKFMVHDCWDRTKIRVAECQKLSRKLINDSQNGTK